MRVYKYASLLHWCWVWGLFKLWGLTSLPHNKRAWGSIECSEMNGSFFFQFEYARVRFPFCIVNNIHSSLLHINPAWPITHLNVCKLKFIEKLDSVIGRFLLRYILKFSISNPMNYEFGSSMSFAKTMQKIEYFKVLPCFLLSLSE